MAADQQAKLGTLRMSGIFDLHGYIGNLRLANLRLANMERSDKVIE